MRDGSEWGLSLGLVEENSGGMDEVGVVKVGGELVELVVGVDGGRA